MKTIYWRWKGEKKKILYKSYIYGEANGILRLADSQHSNPCGFILKKDIEIIKIID